MSVPPSDPSSRLEVLEVHQAFQEDLLHQLNQRIYEQQKQIDRLEHLVDDLAAKLKSLAASAGEALPANERPPHY